MVVHLRTKNHDRKVKLYSGAYLFCCHLLEGARRLHVRRWYFLGQVGKHEAVWWEAHLYSIPKYPAWWGYKERDHRDHSDEAPELYINLSKNWDVVWHRCWEDYPDVSLIWNASGAFHAPRIYEQPLTSVFIWLENVNSRCNLVHCDDCEEIEREFVGLGSWGFQT